MDIIKNAILYFLGFKAYVMLPVIIFIFAMIFRIKLETAIRSALTIGIGFVGIFMVFDYFANLITPVVQAVVKNTGMNFNMVDLGWPSLAALTWTFKLAPLMIPLIMIFNIILLSLKLTKTVDIDIWNYWHFILVSAVVYNITGSSILSIVSGLTTAAFIFKISDWSAPMVNKFSGLNGICTPTLSSATYFPLGIIGDKIIDKIPVINKIDANPEKIKQKLGLAGDPIIIGFIMGMLLGIGGGYSVKQISELAFGMSAVIYILPKMCEIVGVALLPISNGMKEFIQKHFPNLGETYIGLDIAIIIGQPAIVVTGILLMPVALILAFLLPGVKFIPIGDLVNLMGSVALIVVATKGNIVRSFILGIPLVIISLYTASNMGYFFTSLANNLNYKIPGCNGVFTSFLDGGNVLRFWIIKLFSGNLITVIFIPVVAAIVYFTRKFSYERNN